MHKAKFFLSYFLIFLLGMLCGGGAVWHFGWGTMASLMGAPAQAKYNAVDSSEDAYEQTQLLSHLRLGEQQAAIDRGEWMLDMKILDSAAWAKTAHDKAAVTMQWPNLGAVKRYRKMYPSQSKFKANINQILSQVPNLPTPKPGAASPAMPALTRLYKLKRAL